MNPTLEQLILDRLAKRCQNHWRCMQDSEDPNEVAKDRLIELAETVVDFFFTDNGLVRSSPVKDAL